MSEYPLLVTEETARRLERLLRHRIVGGAGIAVYNSPYTTTISLARAQPRDAGEGGGGLSVEVGRIVGLTSDKRSFRVTRLGSVGEPVGDEFVVRAYSIRDGISLVGIQDLSECHPAYVAGNIIRFSKYTVFDGVEWVNDYWTLDTFVPFGCVVMQ